MPKGPSKDELTEAIQEAVEALEDGNPVQAYKVLSPYSEEAKEGDEDDED